MKRSYPTSNESIQEIGLKANTSSKRCYQNIEELKYWMAFDIVPGGLLNRDAGRDQTPVIHLSAIIGSIEDGKEIGRKSVYIKPNSLLRQSGSVTAQLNTVTTSIIQDGDRKEKNLELNNEILSIPMVALDESGLSLKYTDNDELLRLVKDFATFEKALRQIRDFVEETLDERKEKIFPLLITESHTIMRNVFHREMMHRVTSGQLDYELSQYPLWFQYLDIGTLAYRANRPASNHDVPQDFDSTVKLLGIDINKEVRDEFSRVERIQKIVEYCLTKKVSFTTPHRVDEKYIPKILPSDTYVNSDCVIEIRQVPWTATPIILANFFAGLNICPGGVAILLSEGRRSNTAYVLFTDAIMARLALARHQHQLPSSVLMSNNGKSSESHEGTKKKCPDAIDDLMQAQVQRITTLQVFPGSAKDFLSCSVCDIPEVVNFLNQLTSGDQVVVRIRGLPYSTTKDRVVTFFKEVNAEILHNKESCIFLVTYPDKRPTGDAFVLFNDENMANRALTRHKNYVGERYVELFKASPSEMIQVCHNVAKCQSVNGKNFSNQLLQNTNTMQLFQNQIKSNLIMQNQLDPKLLNSVLSGSSDSQLKQAMNSNLIGLQMQDVTAEDLADPTDPNCPFARPIPISGSLSMLQISNLPFNTSRHHVRLYLGPANFAKIYRMTRIEYNITTGSKWLLSVENTSEAVNLIRDLLDKSFPDNAFVIPQFGVFGVSYNGQLYPVNLSDQIELPLSRLAPMTHTFQMPVGNNNPLSTFSSDPNMHCDNSFQLQNTNTVSSPSMTRISPNLIPQTDAMDTNLYISCLPPNVTVFELMSIFQDISNLFISQPKFMCVQVGNETSTYCATFSSSLEVQVCLSLNGTQRTLLRNGQYTAILFQMPSTQRKNQAPHQLQLIPTTLSLDLRIDPYLNAMPMNTFGNGQL